jgi:hypothetical protein
MSYPMYDYQITDINITCETRWSPEEVRNLVKEIFTNWSASLQPVSSQNNQHKIKSELSRREEGQSSADVYELTFHKFTEETSLAKFIIRAHFGAQAEMAATQERNLVQHLIEATNASDLFSGTLNDPITTFSNVVVYRHADDQIGRSSKLLRDSILEFIRARDIEQIESIADELFRVAEIITRTYDTFGHHTVVGGLQYSESVIRRFTPELFINAVGREVQIKDYELSIPTEDGDLPGNPKNIIPRTADDLFAALSSDGEISPRWYCISVFPEAIYRGRGNYLRFKANNLRIWMQLTDDVINTIKIQENQDYKIIFKYEDEIIRLGTDQIQRIGFTKEAILSNEDFRELCRILPDRLERAPCHTDLHCRNILYASGRMKVIDLGSLDDDLLGVSQARLEVSIWEEITKQVPIEIEETEKILDSLAINEEPSFDNLSTAAWALNKILLALRRGMAQGLGNVQISDVQFALAYVTQISLHQRYRIEKSALEPSAKVSEAFNAITRYWLKRFKQLVTGQPVVEGVPSTSALIADNLPTPLLPEEATQPSLYSLWESALISRSLLIVEARPEQFLENILQTQSDWLKAPLTEIQEKIWKKCQEPLERPFQSDLHVIIAAPTSSGKSTLAEMFLVGPPLLNQARKCSLYIAPTRALTQAKYRELKMRFANDTKMSEGVVLSTGEDTDDDWRVTHGQFFIACMVYEKANILFSQNRKLLDRLGCVVIDEMHMLMDLERGPILEMVLTKILWERRRVDALTRRKEQETPRIIAISTEDQLDDAIKQFVSVRDPETGDWLEPLIYTASQRPVPVEHVLILPGIDDASYSAFSIIQFNDTKDRTLSLKNLDILNKRLLAHSQKIPSRLLGQHRDFNKEMRNRLHALLVDLLKEHPVGYRVLVFVAGRRDAEEQARRLKNAYKKKMGSSRISQISQEYTYDDVVSRLKPYLDSSEDQRMAETVRECASAGVLIHHSDIDKKIRFEIENICATILPDAPSQVIFATETLAYGVNLAVHDVILLGIHFHTQTRFREHRFEQLATSAYHNMAGRAGRLGKTSGKNAHVYIIAPRSVDGFDIVKNYYLDIEPAKSKLYVRDDRDVQLRAEDNPFRSLNPSDDPCSQYVGLGASDFSYPFVRSIIDILRHLNTIDAVSVSDHKTAIDIETLLEMLGGTLYARQRIRPRKDEKEPLRFRCAIQLILNDCSQVSLQLVDAREGHPTLYTITQRGEAIIDTGTEIDTVQPLLKIVGDFHTKWDDVCKDRTFPTDLYILCILAQNEIFRQYIYYVPECKGGDAQKDWPEQIADENRERVLDAFIQSLRRITDFHLADAEAFAKAARDILDNWEPIRKIRSAYVNGATDSLLRLFNGIIAWINLEERTVVDGFMEGRLLPDAYKGRIQGFRQFTDILNVKTVFLSKMLATGKVSSRSFGPDEERSLHLLSARLRLGCTTQAIPLFWPFSSDFRRREAAKLLNADITPNQLLAVADPQKLLQSSIGIAPSKLDQLREDLERYAKKEFMELQAVMTEIRTSDAKREASQQLWQEVNRNLTESIRMFQGFDDISVDFDGLLRELLDFRSMSDDNGETLSPILSSPSRLSIDERYRIRIDIPLSEFGMYWHGERQIALDVENDVKKHDGIEQRETRKYSKQHSVKIIGVQFRKDWQYTIGRSQWKPFTDLLHDEQNIRYIVIVALPWTPLQEEMPASLRLALQGRSARSYSISFITPAAFATMVSAITRDFVSSEACMKLLTKQVDGDRMMNVIAVKDIQETIDRTPDRKIPGALREKLIRHFEVAI